MSVLLFILGIATVASWIMKWIEKNASDKDFPILVAENLNPPVAKEAAAAAEPMFFKNEAFVFINNMLCRYLQKNNIKYSAINNGALFRITFDKEEDFPIEVAIKIHPEGLYLTFNALMYADVPDNKMNAVTELIARLNGGFVIGHFNLLYDSGHAEFEATVVLQNMQLTESIIEIYMTHTCNAPLKYGPLFRKVIAQDVEILLELIDFENKAKPGKKGE